MKKYLFLVFAIVGLISCNQEYTQEQSRKEALKLCEDYVESYQKYCMNKFDGYNYDGIISTDNIYIREYYPDLYEKYIKDIEHKWDSLRTIDSYYVENQKVKVKNKTDIKIKNSNIITNSDGAVVNDKIKTINKSK